MKIFKSVILTLFLCITSVILFACDKNAEENNEVESYTVIWKDSDGTILETEVLDYGVLPNKALPNDTAQWTYESWSPSISEVTKDVTYIAMRYATLYEITWLDADGSTLGTTKVGYGETPTYALPDDTVEWDYTEWAPALDEVTGDATYQASRVKQTYTIAFNTDGGTKIDSQTLAYGSEVSKPADPEKEGFSFVGWTIEGETSTIEWPLNINSNTTLVAVWNEKVAYGTYLESLLNNYFFDPYSFVP